jgi:hypothetical protein
MISILSLWMPIVLAAVLVFIGSSVIHMFLTYHRNDYAALPDEAGVMEALRPFGIAPGDYIMPFANGSEDMRSDAYKAKVEQGPVATLTVWPEGAVFNMGPQLAQWFAYCLLVAVFSAYVATRTLAPGADYLAVFRLTGTVAFACYAMALPQRSIWWKQNWPATLKSMFDGFVYACLTAGAFGWLWP